MWSGPAFSSVFPYPLYEASLQNKTLLYVIHISSKVILFKNISNHDTSLDKIFDHIVTIKIRVLIMVCICLDDLLTPQFYWPLSGSLNA